MTIISRTLTLVTCLQITACGIVPPIPTGAYSNIELTKSDPAGLIADRATLNVPNGDTTPSVFIGIAMSGGGSRAAYFGASVLEQLDRAGFLDDVKVISSVSGGSLAAAGFALDGVEIKTDEDWIKFKDSMAYSYRSSWLLSQFNPINILSVAATETTRTMLMADQFDKQFIHGRTYGDLGGMGPRKPQLYINATDTVGAPGTRFLFTSHYFNILKSDISKYRISEAVVASAAFPAVFNPITLRRFPTASEKTGGTPGWSTYHHLIDGGPSDNLGIEALSDLALQYHSIWRIRGTGPFSCLMILVDAYPASFDQNRGFEKEARRGFLDYFIDRSFVDAFDALLTRRRNDALAELGFTLTRSGLAFSSNNTAKLRYMSGELRKASFVTAYDRVITTPISNITKEEGKASASDSAANCLVWHIPLDQVNSLPPVYGLKPSNLDPVVLHRQDVSEIVKRIPTDFDLSGPKHCTKAVLRSSIEDAARILIVEDVTSRNQVCKWYRSSFPKKVFNCEVDSSVAQQTRLDLKIEPWPNTSVECMPEAASKASAP